MSILIYSAGVGRTGAFIAIDHEIQRLRHEGIVDVYNYVLKMRYYRNCMVQSAVRCDYACNLSSMYIKIAI